MNGLEIVAAVFGFVCVWLYIRRNVWAWPTGLIQVALLIVVFRDAKLYADMALHVVYVVLQVYGWWAWVKSRAAPGESKLAAVPIQVRRLRPSELVAYLVSTVILTLAFGAALATWTDASLPYLDAFIAAASLIAQYLLAARYLENWGFWILIDIVAIGLFAFKELYPTAVLYGLFLILSVIGWRAWRKSG